MKNMLRFLAKFLAFAGEHNKAALAYALCERIERDKNIKLMLREAAMSCLKIEKNESDIRLSSRAWYEKVKRYMPVI